MKKIILLLTIFFVLPFINPESVKAANCFKVAGIEVMGDPPTQITQNVDTSYEISIVGTKSTEYTLIIDTPKLFEANKITFTTNNSGIGKASFNNSNTPLAFEQKSNARKTVRLYLNSDSMNKCLLHSYEIIKIQGSSCDISYTQDGYNNPTCVEINSPINISISNATYNGEVYNGTFLINYGSTKKYYGTITSGTGALSKPITITKGDENILLETFPTTGFTPSIPEMCSQPIPIAKATCSEEERKSYNATDTTPLDVCKSIPDDTLKSKCIACMGSGGDGSTGGVWTGLGCIKFSPKDLVKQILQIAVGLGGGIAFLLLIYGAFLMTTSAGNPEATDNAKQIITSAITGLLVIIFSVVILNIIGVQVLQIPGL